MSHSLIIILVGLIFQIQVKAQTKENEAQLLQKRQEEVMSREIKNGPEIERKVMSREGSGCSSGGSVSDCYRTMLKQGQIDSEKIYQFYADLGQRSATKDMAEGKLTLMQMYLVASENLILATEAIDLKKSWANGYKLVHKDNAKELDGYKSLESGQMQRRAKEYLNKAGDFIVLWGKDNATAANPTRSKEEAQIQMNKVKNLLERKKVLESRKYEF